MYMKNPKSGLPDNHQIENPFVNEDEENNILIIVENTHLYVNGDMLKILSPVFRAMLSEYFAEGQQKRIDLKGKKAKDIITMFLFFYPCQDIWFSGNFDFYPLLDLCEEYQLCWLRKKINSYLMASFSKMVEGSQEGEMVVYLLYLAERFKMDDLKKICLTHNLTTTASMGKIVNFISLLSKDSRRVIYKSYLSKRMGRCEYNCKSKINSSCGIDVTDNTFLKSTDKFFE